MTENNTNVRIDKWLWAARFCKTRSLAREMIEGGNVENNQNRTKPGKVVEIGSHITITKGYNKIEVVVLGISDIRREAKLAQQLYEETPESVKKREDLELARKQNILFSPHPDQKPDKKQRRELIDLKYNY